MVVDITLMTFFNPNCRVTKSLLVIKPDVENKTIILHK